MKKQEAKKNLKDLHMIIGLGNPGSEYIGSRHNLGFTAIDLFCAKYNLRLFDKYFQALHVKADCFGKKVILACPQTFMNRSGYSVRLLATNYRPEPKNILVIHDDLDIETGRAKIVSGGGAGGHRGVRSIISQLGTDKFSRIKIGIGRPRYHESVEDFVLATPYKDQRKIIKEMQQLIVKVMELFISDGIESAMSNFNSLLNIKMEEESQCKV